MCWFLGRKLRLERAGLSPQLPAYRYGVRAIEGASPIHVTEEDVSRNRYTPNHMKTWCVASRGLEVPFVPHQMSNRRHQLQETVTETASEPPVAPSPAGPMEKTIR